MADMEMESTTFGDRSSTMPPADYSSSTLNVAKVDPVDKDVNAQELPPADRGIRAWTFCAAGFVLEMMTWGFGFRSVFSRRWRLRTCVTNRTLLQLRYLSRYDLLTVFQYARAHHAQITIPRIPLSTHRPELPLQL